jgi:hypothetical protein
VGGLAAVKPNSPGLRTSQAHLCFIRRGHGLSQIKKLREPVKSAGKPVKDMILKKVDLRPANL